MKGCWGRCEGGGGGGGGGVLLTGTQPAHLGITLDMGSEVFASHRLMEPVRLEEAAGEGRTAVYSPVISLRQSVTDAEAPSN